MAERPDEEVRLVPYDPKWPALYAAEAARLAEAIGPWIVDGIHHVGSTAVPGLTSKPVIDILVGVESLPASLPCIDLVEPLDYVYFPYRPDEMHWFCKPDPTHRTHHLHLVPASSERYADEIAFRDYLCSHTDRARAYERLKISLAEEHHHDREAYTDGKSVFIRATLDLAAGTS
ncbi:MAG: GrpB family protein [Actinomycetota bacterium]